MIETFLKYIEYEKRYSKHTIISYKTDLGQFQNYIAEFYPALGLHQVDYRIIRSWIVSLVDSGVQNISVNRKMAAIRSFYKFLLKREIINDDPSKKLNALKTAKKLPQFINEDDISHLLDHINFENTIDGQREKLILELFYGTGIRLSELINLKEENINFNQQTIKVLGKRNKERIIPFSRSLDTIIKNYLSLKVRASEFLLLTNSGKKLYEMYVYRIVKKYLNLINVDKRSPHVLRHTYATHLLNKGADLNAVKDLLGHTSLAATQVYTHNSIEKLKSVFEKAHPKA